jgi:hypothetical protein
MIGTDLGLLVSGLAKVFVDKQGRVCEVHAKMLRAEEESLSSLPLVGI